jgi:RNA 2',3'-cyclic 3'-phosphodiesterase
MARDPGVKAQRVFFALWPDTAARSRLAELAREVAFASGGRPTAPELFHLTLAFLGDQPASAVEALRNLAGAIRAHRFVLALDAVGAFRHSGIVWLGATAPQPELAALHDALAAALRVQGFAVDERPYAPHLTLSRRSRIAIDRRLPQPICWRADCFALVVSELGRGVPSYRTFAE